MTNIPTSRRKRILFTGILFATVLSAAALTEGVLRMTSPWLAEAYATPIDPKVGYGITLGHPFSLNRFGFREADFPIDRPAGETRILCLGDSITFGYGLPAEDAWPKILERNLQEFSRERIFCINAAGNAATTHEELALYDKRARGFGASTVVLGFCMNDVRLKKHQNDVRQTRSATAQPRCGSGAPRPRRRRAVRRRGRGSRCCRRCGGRRRPRGRRRAPAVDGLVPLDVVVAVGLQDDPGQHRLEVQLLAVGDLDAFLFALHGASGAWDAAVDMGGTLGGARQGAR